ncbi:MAG TPA: hypothetical protein VNI57_01180, partial [Candidatus Saccharimonadales bacterium]|nr:hypothetical protein [Candidatus Saccharimonadales bacterium]
PAAWGTEPRLVELFGPGASDIRTERKMCVFRYPSAEHFVDFFREYYGPIKRVFAALDDPGRQAFHDALTALVREWNRSTRGSLVAPGEYLEVVITKSAV